MKAHIEVIGSTPNDAAYAALFTDGYDQHFPYGVQIVSSTATAIQFRFVNAKGNTLVPGSLMSSGTSTYFQSQIILAVTLTA